VCFESAFSSLAREQRRNGAQVLVSLTNDEAFGDGFPGRAARAQHEAHLVLRAVEGRVAVLRAANGGRSMVVDPSGHVRFSASDRDEALTLVEVFPTSTLTLTERTGDVAGPLCALGSMLLIWMALRARSGRRMTPGS
jgi:apolipoprotein N-acyltransferase